MYAEIKESGQTKRNSMKVIVGCAVGCALLLCAAYAGHQDVGVDAMFAVAAPLASMVRPITHGKPFHRTSMRAGIPVSSRVAQVKTYAGSESGASSFTLDQIRELVGDDMANQLLQSSTASGEDRDVVLYGFGRIGRLMARILLSTPTNLKVKAVVQRPIKNQDTALAKRAELLLRDSVHGMFSGSIDIDQENEALIVNGQTVKFITANNPDEIDYEAHGLKDALIVDNTGVWRDAEGLARHLSSKGATQVILTAPGKGMKNVVAKVNSDSIEGSDTIISAASCTTNAVAPPLKVIDEAFGVVSGHLETVHSYTNDQNLIDNYHKANRRGRAAALNMVISETGAGKAVSKALPNLEGKLTSNAIRVPTPDVSMAVLVLQLGKETTAEELNAAFKTAAEGELSDTLGYSESTEAVSQDFIGSKNAGVIDAPATMCKGSACTVYIWYDNENGYSNQVVRVMETLNALTAAAC